VVLLNAAAALMAGGAVGDLREGLEMAAAAIDSGAAYNVLQRFVAFTNAVGVAGR
jgi:anthranilate phosphoribosyltransferase